MEVTALRSGRKLCEKTYIGRKPVEPPFGYCQWSDIVYDPGFFLLAKKIAHVNRFAAASRVAHYRDQKAWKDAVLGDESYAQDDPTGTIWFLLYAKKYGYRLRAGPELARHALEKALECGYIVNLDIPLDFIPDDVRFEKNWLMGDPVTVKVACTQAIFSLQTADPNPVYPPETMEWLYECCAYFIRVGHPVRHWQGVGSVMLYGDFLNYSLAARKTVGKMMVLLEDRDTKRGLYASLLKIVNMYLLSHFDTISEVLYEVGRFATELGRIPRGPEVVDRKAFYKRFVADCQAMNIDVLKNPLEWLHKSLNCTGLGGEAFAYCVALYDENHAAAKRAVHKWVSIARLGLGFHKDPTRIIAQHVWAWRDKWEVELPVHLEKLEEAVEKRQKK